MTSNNDNTAGPRTPSQQGANVAVGRGTLRSGATYSPMSTNRQLPASPMAGSVGASGGQNGGTSTPLKVTHYLNSIESKTENEILFTHDLSNNCYLANECLLQVGTPGQLFPDSPTSRIAVSGIRGQFSPIMRRGAGMLGTSNQTPGISLLNRDIPGEQTKPGPPGPGNPSAATPNASGVHDKGTHVEVDLDGSMEFLESTAQVENSSLDYTCLPNPKEIAFKNRLEKLVQLRRRSKNKVENIDVDEEGITSKSSNITNSLSIQDEGGNSSKEKPSGKEGEKRKMDEEAGEGGEGPSGRQPKKNKITYSEATKVSMVVEIRCSDKERELDQEDFNQVEAELTNIWGMDDNITWDWNEELSSQGKTQGVLWWACKSDVLKDFIYEHVSAIEPPEGREGYGYVVYKPDDRPYRYFLIPGIKVSLWRETATFLKFFRKLNPKLNYPVELPDGTTRQTHIRISSGLRNRAKEVMDKKDGKGGHFSIRIEVDKCLMNQILAPPMNGAVRVGAGSTIIVRGGGIEQAKRERQEEMKRMEVAMRRMEVDNTTKNKTD